jgi:hypothetical protein
MSSFFTDAWVCDSCEQNIDTLGPWDFHKRFPEDTDETHNIFHLLVRVDRSPAHSIKTDENALSKDRDLSPLDHWERVEKRIDALVTRFEAVNNHVDERLKDVESQITLGFANIERLLNARTQVDNP